MSSASSASKAASVSPAPPSNRWPSSPTASPSPAPRVEQVRGVNSDGAIASLIARGLAEEVGKAPGPGRPGLLGTTMKFLEHFGLANPTDLPPLASAEMAATLGLDMEDDATEDEDTAVDEDEALVDATESTEAEPVTE